MQFFVEKKSVVRKIWGRATPYFLFLRGPLLNFLPCMSSHIFLGGLCCVWCVGFVLPAKTPTNEFKTLIPILVMAQKAAVILPV
jgi:hypothetical protein